MWLLISLQGGLPACWLGYAHVMRPATYQQSSTVSTAGTPLIHLVHWY